jgi:PPM family protein phosphatase
VPVSFGTWRFESSHPHRGATLLKEVTTGTDKKPVGPRTSREDDAAHRARPPATPRPGARARGDTPTSALRLARELDLEERLISADATAPRRDAATRRAGRHPGHNEDRVLCHPTRGVAAVFDGIGGEAGGELASRAACGAMALALDGLPPREDEEGRRRWLAAAITSGHEAIALSKRLHGEYAGQGTTAIAAVLTADKVLTSCVGDSRAYLVSRGRLSVIADEHEDTVPRPAMADALDRVTAAEDFERAPKDLSWAFTYRNIVAAELGSDTAHVTVREHPLASGDLVLVVSDGVHDNLAHQEIEAVVAECAGGPAQALATALVARAHERSQDREHLRSKDDDVSCAVLQA